jgi:hypothetical protein
MKRDSSVGFARPTIATRGNSVMDQLNLDDGLEAARLVARSGEYRSWRAVETKLHQMGHHDAGLWFAPSCVRGEIDHICAMHFK